jgi:type 2 lantibiotic biosynthesis protein LanM
MQKDQGDSSNWHKAMTLQERIDTLRILPCDIASADIKVAVARLSAWKAQPPFNTKNYFSQCLALNEITEDTFTCLIGESDENAKQRFTASTGWLNMMQIAFAEHSLIKSQDHSLFEKQEMGRILVVVEPLIRHTLDVIEQRVVTLKKIYDDIPIDIENVKSIFLQAFLNPIFFLIFRTLILELNVARLNGILIGATSEERFSAFIEYLKNPSNARALLNEYPVMARLVMTRLEDIGNYIVRFIEYLCEDWGIIKDTFFDRKHVGNLIGLQMGMGDLHKKGQSVMIAQFMDDLKLVFKPRSLGVDLHFQELLDWLNCRGAEPPFRMLKIIDRNSHGWVEFVAPKSCCSPDEIKRFYKRQGANLAILYILEATDFHFENLIRDGEHPVLIDVESLFHPRILEEKSGGLSDTLLSKVLSGSLLRIGLLPMYIMEKHNQKGLDISGLSALAGQLAPQPIPFINKEETDEMQVSLKQWIFEGGQNRPKLGEYDVDIINYANYITDGFSSTYRLLIKYRNELLGSDGPIARFAEDVIRVIMRPTRTYAKLLFESCHPDYLRDALDREQFLDYLWVGVEDVPQLAKVIKYEHNDLYNGDVPFFTTRPSSHAIISSSGQIVEHFIEKTGTDRVKKRINGLREDQIEKHNWFIKASLVTLTDSDHKILSVANPITENKPVRNNKLSHERLLNSACAIGDHLSKIAMDDGDGVNWLGISPGGDSMQRWTITPLGIDLYSGISGVVIFFAYLVFVTRNKRYKSIYNRALATMLRILSELKIRPDLLSIGAFTGWGSIIYTLSHLGYIGNDHELIREAEKAAELLPSLIDQDIRYDIIAGSAGCIGALLVLYKITTSKRILEIAEMCGNRIVNNAKKMKQGVGWVVDTFSDKPLSGFSHGAAGISWSLLELYNVTKNLRFLEKAKQGINYERTLYDQETKNWFDLRRAFLIDNSNISAKPRVQNAWCHGAPGIGMARLKSLKYLHDIDILSEIHVALESTIKFGFGEHNHSLCHGVLGNLELLLQAREVLNNEYDSDIVNITITILNSIDQNGWQCATPLGVETPSFMVGLSGIGYQLLRIAEPKKVPAVLLLEPPFIRNR